MIKKKGQAKFQVCPICKHEFFTEWARQVTFQNCVRIDKTGASDYEHADVNEFDDEFEVIEWTCENCGVSVRIDDKGKLEAVPEN